MVNTFGLGVVTVILSLIVGSLAGLAFAWFEFNGKNALWTISLIDFMVPYKATVTPAYSLINGLGWINTWAALIILSIAHGTVIFLLKQFSPKFLET